MSQSRRAAPPLLPISPRASASEGHLEAHDLLAGLAILVGLVGVVAVLVPGLALQVLAVVVWAAIESSVGGWATLAAVLVVAVVATVLKYLHPGRRLKAAGLPHWLLLVSATAAAVGFFAIPVVGAPLGFVASIYLFERRRRGRAAAWPSTKAALGAIVTSIGIELAGAFIITVIFFVAAIAL